MRTKLVILAILLVLGIALVSLAQTSAPQTPNPAATTNKASQTQSSSARHLPAGFSPDDAYKANCTRCHAEVPLSSSRKTKTIIQHMRVRANLTKDEAEAILEYLNQ